MRCPTCRQHTPDDWSTYVASVRNPAGGFTETLDLPGGQPHADSVAVDWMHCANPDCEELVIRVHESYTVAAPGGPPVQMPTASRTARPRTTIRPIDPLVPDDIKGKYSQAAAILDLSPPMSAVLSGRILADVLERYAGLSDFSLRARVDQFIADAKHPRRLRENLHYLREIRDFGAHTQRDDQLEVIDATREDAEWMLEVIDGLLEYLIVAPEKDRAMRDSWDVKLADADRRPVEPLPPDEDEPTEAQA
jgi:hypothetical protein